MREDCIARAALRQDERWMINFAAGGLLAKGTTFDFAIVGGGLVGLATAWALQSKYPDARLVLLEKESQVAQHQSGRNSGVLHSGIYYKPGSLKAQLVARGRRLMLDFCDEFSIRHKLCGKIIVATREEEFQQLENLAGRGKENGLETKILNQDEVREIEPHAAGLKAIWIPQTGIVDFVAAAQKVAEQVIKRGVQVRLVSAVLDLKEAGKDLILRSATGDISTRFAINCAGLFSDRLARKAGVEPDLRIIPFRGEYFALSPEASHLVRGLIYPLVNPRLPFLGVHLTRTTRGEVLVGPNAVLALRREGYHPWDIKVRDVMDWASYPGFWKLIFANIGPGLGEMLKAWSLSSFTKATQKLVPEIKTTDLMPATAGVRAQAVDSQGKLVDDFCFAQSKKWFHVLNAPSPAATACFAIGEWIARKIELSLN